MSKINILGFSRRNSNQTRDLNEKKGNCFSLWVGMPHNP